MLMGCTVNALASVDVHGTPMGIPKLRLISFGPYTAAPHECCEGVLTVSLSEIYPTAEPFPTRLQQTNKSAPRSGGGCGEPRAVPLNVQYLTCVQTVDQSGNMPDAAKRNAEHRRLIDAAHMVFNEVTCCIQSWRAEYGLVKMNTGVTFVAPSGGCAGFEYTAIAPVDPCYPC